MKRIWNALKFAAYCVWVCAESAALAFFCPRKLHNPAEGICIGRMDGRDVL